MIGRHRYKGDAIILCKLCKILFIGGHETYTKDMACWLWKILHEAGYKSIIIGIAVIRNKRDDLSIRDHFEAIVETAVAAELYDYYKYTSLTSPFITEELYINDILSDEIWNTDQEEN